MDFVLNQICPNPLAGQFIDEAIWEKKVTLQYGQGYLVQAESGKGKSTLIGILSGTRRDYIGEMEYGSENITLWNTAQWAAFRCQALAVVYQDLRLFQTLTAWENICLSPVPLNESQKLKAHEMAIKFGLENLLHRKAALLSMGQLQRVAIIRALAKSFRWLLLDEPFSHLDKKNQDIIWEVIQQRLYEEKAGWILTSLDESRQWQANHRLIV